MKYINENALLTKIGMFFSKSDKVIFELLQNSKRASAGSVSITTDYISRSIHVVDDGIGISEPLPLFILADSAWDSNIQMSQNPAGWGMFFLYSISESVFFRSKFGSINIDCRLFLSSPEYRNTFLATVDKTDSIEGFEVYAVLQKEYSEFLDISVPQTNRIVDLTDNEKSYLQIYFYLSLYDMNISLNGRRIKPMVIDKDKFKITGEYKDNLLLLNSFSCISRHFTNILWFGQLISDSSPFSTNRAYDYIIHEDMSLSNFFQDIYIINNNNSPPPLTPVLPFREKLKQDMLYSEFKNHILLIKNEYAIQMINILSMDVDNNRYDLEKYLRYVIEHGNQTQIDRLRIYMVTELDLINKIAGADDKNSKTIFVNRNECLTSNDISLKVIYEDKNNFVTEYPISQFYTPDVTLKTYELPQKIPSWLKHDVVVHNIDIKVKESDFKSLYFNWYKISEIKSTIPGITNLVISPEEEFSNYDISFLYSSADSMSVLNDYVVFQSFYFQDEGDLYDTQQAKFEEQFFADIRKIQDKFYLPSLLSGFTVIDGISTTALSSIKEIKVEDNMIFITFMDNTTITKEVY